MKIEGRRALKAMIDSSVTLENLIVQAAAAARPPERLTVSQAAEKYRHLNIPGAYVGPLKNDLTPYLVEPMDTLQSLDFTGMIFAGPAQCAKALALDTPVPTPSGWTTMGAIRAGDWVLGSTGKPVRVLLAQPVQLGHQCFEVRFDDGTTIIADAGHRWAVEDRFSENAKVLTTADMVRMGTVFREKRCRFRVRNSLPLDLQDSDLQIDPYVMGLWLGDGSRSSGQIAVGDEDFNETVLALESRGYSVVVYEDPAKVRCRSLRVKRGEKTFHHQLDRMGLLKTRKFIPVEYLRGSEHQRRELLRGLMDSDGSVAAKNAVVFCQKDRQLVEQVAELVRSFGYKPRMGRFIARCNGKDHGEAFRIQWTSYCGSDIFSLPRKIAKCGFTKSRKGQTETRGIVAIVPVPSVPVRCIGVDAPDHLFLAGKGMIPTHNTEMVLNWLTYSAVCDPADMMIVQTTNTTARDFSMRRIDRMHRHSPDVGALLLHGKQGDNVFDKHYTSGMMLTLSWPAINELSGKPIPRGWLTDYDRMPEDINGEGSAFDLGRKRGTTFGRHCMWVAESSPGFAIENPKWQRKTAHEAPPTKGILALYNKGDRRRWMWQCVQCHGKFEPSFELLDWPDTADKMEAAEAAVLKCPHCDTKYNHNPTGDMPGKHELNRGGKWIKDGVIWRRDGSITGTPIRSTIASFWLKGAAAAFSDWKTLVFNYLSAEEEYEANGSEESLKTTINTDQGEAYLPKSLANDRVPETIKARAKDLGAKLVPEGVRFLIATIDVQKNRFVVQIQGIALNKDVYVIDRFEVKKSKRKDEDGEHKWVNPGAYPEDWKILAEEVLLKTYELGDGSGRQMAIKLTLCDSGGKDGVTANAYNFVRWLRAGENDPEDAEPSVAEEGSYRWEAGMAGRFMLVKGASTKNAPRVAVSYPDSQRKDRAAGGRGEIPVLMINPNSLKDMVDHRLDRTEAGGRFVFANWLPDSFYTELTVEIKHPVKGWINPKKYRNESWDLLAYCLAGMLTTIIGIDRWNLEEPPKWAEEWDHNDLVFNPEVVQKPFEAKKKSGVTLEQLAKALA